MTMRVLCQGCGQWLDAMQITPHGCKKPESLVDRLRKRAEIRRQIPGRKSVENGEPDRIADLLEEAADQIEHLEKVRDLHKDAHRKCVELSREQLKEEKARADRLAYHLKLIAGVEGQD